MDILLANNGDAVFYNGNAANAVTTDLSTALAQKLKIKLQTFAGEWFLDQSEGVPYFQQIFGRGRQKKTVDAIFQSQILAEPLVAKIISYTSTWGSDRTFSVTFQVQTTTGLTTAPVTITPISVGG